MEESNQQIQPQGFFHFLKTLSLSSWLYTPLDLLPTHGATPQRVPCGPCSQDLGQLQVPPPGPRWPRRFTTAQSKSGPNGSFQPTPLSHEKPFFKKMTKENDYYFKRWNKCLGPTPCRSNSPRVGEVGEAVYLVWTCRF